MKGISVKDFTIEQIDKAQSLLEDVERAERELNNFMETDIFINNSEELNPDWKSKLYDFMFEIGNWYFVGEDKINFIIPTYLLGINGSYENIIEICVDNSDN